MFQSIHFFLYDFLLFFSHGIWSGKEWGFIFQLQVYFNKWTCAYLISKTKYIMEIISLGQKSSFPLSSNAQSDKFSFIQSISVSVMCHHLSSGSNQGYLSSCVGTFMSLVVISVQVEICAIFAGSIGLSYAIGLGLRVVGVTLSCRYWSIGKCFKLLICTRPFDLASKYATS